MIVQVMLRLLSKPVFKGSDPCHCAHITIVGLKWPRVVLGLLWAFKLLLGCLCCVDFVLPCWMGGLVCLLIGGVWAPVALRMRSHVAGVVCAEC